MGHRVQYIRDVFQVFEDLIFAPNEDAAIVAKELLQARPPIHISEFGIGGLVLRSEKLILVPDDLREEVETISKLQERGFCIDFLPVPPLTQDSGILVRRMNFSKHLDMEINIVYSQGRLVVVANEDYYKERKDRVDKILHNYQGQLVIISDPREQTLLRAVNFVELPDGRVIIPENCNQAISALKNVLGKPNVLGENVDFSKSKSRANSYVNGGPITYYLHGGLRCLTNSVY